MTEWQDPLARIILLRHVCKCLRRLVAWMSPAWSPWRRTAFVIAFSSLLEESKRCFRFRLKTRRYLVTWLELQALHTKLIIQHPLPLPKPLEFPLSFIQKGFLVRRTMYGPIYACQILLRHNWLLLGKICPAQLER